MADLLGGMVANAIAAATQPQPTPLHVHLGAGLVPPKGYCELRPLPKPATPPVKEVRRWLTAGHRAPLRSTWDASQQPADQDGPDPARTLTDLYTITDAIEAAGKTVRVRASAGYLVVEVVG